MDEAVTQIKRLVETSDELGRRRIMESLHKLAYSMESPEDTRDRYSFLHLQTATVKIGFNLELFKYMASSTKAVSVDEATRKTGGQKELIGRLLRYLSSIGAIDEISAGQYLANRVTRNLAGEAAEAGICHYFGSVSMQYQELPSFLERSGYKEPVDETNTAFHQAWKTPLSPFIWYDSQPRLAKYFNDYMATRSQPQQSWLKVYPVLEEATNLHPERALYVDVGGGIGHQCAQFKDKYPELQGRVILQDLPFAIAEALPTPGVENMVHDVFEPQPIRGAKIYHMRSILHNHPQHKVSQILQNIKAVMAPDSILLVDEMILPEVGVDAVTAAVDLTMLSAFAARERTEAEWRKTFDEAGLELVQARIYNPLTYEGVLDARLHARGTKSQVGNETAWAQ
ncbi:O-methyl transferase B [Annulohypoxylon truncatum]|uniref:O-methyl transferase B n=1 Tax=Annulohypoxylon truncatum TaxID=327061 RepID=UPI0020080C4F|nr:O-methyl transferase B [Annulohypoxylon truncatum]KAI1207206.1 O-methyl transferase B [Annulohypoxylon truncatum]